MAKDQFLSFRWNSVDIVRSKCEKYEKRNSLHSTYKSRSQSIQCHGFEVGIKDAFLLHLAWLEHMTQLFVPCDNFSAD